METVRTDPATGRVFRRGVRPMVVRYKGLSREVAAPGWWPDDGADDDGVLVGDDMRVWDDALHDMKRELGELPAEPVRTPGAAE